MLDAPKFNTLAVSWFYSENQKGTLILTPKYQRNPIWSLGQKCFLIDSVIFGCPIPQVYLNTRTEGAARERKTVYEVVDGQQRLRAILEFMNDEWPLVPTAAKAYPVSDLYKPHIGKRYSELPDNLQNRIWDYPLSVQELSGKEPHEIHALFRRLNYVVERLSKQELRHSQYFGEFTEAIEFLAKDTFWDAINLFTRKDAQRMKDIEFVSELFVIVIDGIQDGQSLDRFYADYDVALPQKSRHIAKFKQVLASLATIQATIKETRFHKKADFYGLFAAALALNENLPKPADLSPASDALARLSTDLRSHPEDLTGVAKNYQTTVIAGVTNLAKRKSRAEIIQEILASAIGG